MRLGGGTSPFTHRRKRLQQAVVATFVFVALVVVLWRGVPLLWVGKVLTSAGSAVGRAVSFQEEATVRAQKESETFVHQTLLEEELAQLREILQVPEANVPRLTVRVVARTTSLDRAEALLDKGARAGIRAGQPLVVGERTLIGTIVEVTEESARARLLSDFRSRIPVRVAGAQTIGVVEGSGGALLPVSYIPQGVSLNLGDEVFTSTLASPIPEGLLIGTIRTVVKEETDVFQTAHVESAVDARFYHVMSVLLTPVL